MKPSIYLKFKNYLKVSILILTLSSCKKLVEVPAPVNSINSANIYNNDATAAAVLTGVYTNMINVGSLNGNNQSINSSSFYCGLSADELSLYPGANTINYTEFYTNKLNSGDISPDYWTTLYQMIFVANSAIEGLGASTGLTPSVKQQALGEAQFVRAFSYFYLVNLYGDAPLVLTTDYKTNAAIARTPKLQVWQQIIADLKSAQGLLSSDYLDGTLQNVTSQRLRPTKWAATALLARAYLYYGNLTGDAANYTRADSAATAVINNSSLFSLSSLNNAFLANSTEAIWQLQPTITGDNTPDALTFIIPSTGPNSQWPVYLSPQLLNSFEKGDQRRQNWVDSVIVGSSTYYYPYKYKVDLFGAPVTEYEMVLRLGEQFLIRAEAEAELNQSGPAINDLNAIRTRAGLPGTTAATPSALLTAIQHEREVELFSEWGHRWLDLKRTGTVDAVMSMVTPQKGGTWNTNEALYPIALGQLQMDPNLVQNKGY